MMKTRKSSLAILSAILLFACGCQEKNVTTTANKHVNVTVIDKTAPVISVTDKAIEEGETVTLSDCFKVTDNMDKKPTSEVKTASKDFSIKDEKFTGDKEGKYAFTITAKDASGNSSTGTLTITVNKKPEPTPEATPEPEQPAQPSVSKPQAPKNNSNSGSNNTAPSQPQPDNPAPVQPSQPQQSQSSGEPVTKYFNFSDGYDMNSAGPACQAEMGKYGNGHKACTPIKGDDGLYKGYVFTYTPS